jgi:hypothetical protein
MGLFRKWDCVRLHGWDSLGGFVSIEVFFGFVRCLCTVAISHLSLATATSRVDLGGEGLHSREQLPP